MKRTVKIGRSKSNDCVFENPSVSSNHAVMTISEDGQSAVLRDLASTNGTFVNNKRVQQEVTVSKTDIIRFGSEQTSLADIEARLAKTVIKRSDTPARGLTIGKSSDNRIVMNHDDVSRRHAVLYKNEKGEIVIEDSGSTNGTYVNGTKITSKVLLPGDKVTITRNYPLDWAKYFKTDEKPSKVSRPAFMTILACIALLVIGSIVFLILGNRSLSKEQIYEKYNKAVCFVDLKWGMKVYLDGDDVTGDLFNAPYINVSDNGEIVKGCPESYGTAFFISKDGKLATNLHITKPWLFSSAPQAIEQYVSKIVAQNAMNNPALAGSKVEVKSFMTSLYIVLNGLPNSSGNRIACMEYSGGDDPLKDVAIIQTETRSLPSDDINIIDIEKADDSEEAYTAGKTVYTIGFPFGLNYGVSLDSNNDLSNQIHSGSITRDRGDYEFSHDAETAGGASGSPIINEKGKLIGVHHSGMTGVDGSQGFNNGIKVKWLKELMNK